MPRLALQIKATLEGVASLQPQPGRLWHMKTKCENCGESSEHPMTASTSEEVEIDGSRGKAHLTYKCKTCNRQGSITIEEEKHEYTAENAAASEFATIMELDARGMTPIEFSFMNGWIAKGGGDSSATFDDVDLTEGEWAEYDEDADASLTIMDLESRFEAAEKHKHGSRRKK